MLCCHHQVVQQPEGKRPPIRNIAELTAGGGAHAALCLLSLKRLSAPPFSGLVKTCLAGSYGIAKWATQRRLLLAAMLGLLSHVDLDASDITAALVLTSATQNRRCAPGSLVGRLRACVPAAARTPSNRLCVCLLARQQSVLPCAIPNLSCRRRLRVAKALLPVYRALRSTVEERSHRGLSISSAASASNGVSLGMGPGIKSCSDPETLAGQAAAALLHGSVCGSPVLPRALPKLLPFTKACPAPLVAPAADGGCSEASSVYDVPNDRELNTVLATRRRSAELPPAGPSSTPAQPPAGPDGDGGLHVARARRRSKNKSVTWGGVPAAPEEPHSGVLPEAGAGQPPASSGGGALEGDLGEPEGSAGDVPGAGAGSTLVGAGSLPLTEENVQALDRLQRLSHSQPDAQVWHVAVAPALRPLCCVLCGPAVVLGSMLCGRCTAAA